MHLIFVLLDFKFRLALIILVCLICFSAWSQSNISGKVVDHSGNPLIGASIKIKGTDIATKTNEQGNFSLQNGSPASPVIIVSYKGFADKEVKVSSLADNLVITLKKEFQWHDLINPQFYIEFGGLWLLLFVIFAETGLFAGFFLPGDSLLFVAGIYSDDLASQVIATGNSVIDLFILWILISAAGIIGNYVGYWFGKKSGPYLYERKDTFLFKKKYLKQAHDFYERYGGWAIVAARFVPIIRTFAPIVAGIVGMERKKFTFFNIIGCAAWVASMLIAGHFLYQWVLNQFNIDIKEHLEMIVIVIVLVSTVPILFKFFFSKEKKTTV
jgi:membrane-associated protein